jgi:glycosyltransferase involved in cell wall biosynthesis
VRTAIVVSSLNRPQVLHETVLAIGRQTIPPTTTIVSLCDNTSLLIETADLPLVCLVHGPRGLTKQRNTGLRALPPAAEYVLLLDDDAELAPNYLESMERLFDSRSDVVVASAGSALDGRLLGRQLTREEAIAAVRKHPSVSRTEPAESAWGCNMFVRRSVFETVSFDERLPLDGWLEDYDFSVRCEQHGRSVWNLETCVAHLGVQRASGERGFLVGYSQIANSYYLWQKGVIPSFGKLLRTFWLPALRASVQGAVRGRPPWNAIFDYRGRIRGNVRALIDAASFRLTPERILDFV